MLSNRGHQGGIKKNLYYQTIFAGLLDNVSSVGMALRFKKL
ncbi:hypothetical protein M153_3100040654 [Pseudoloma neurophilia]|uniref:Uncharacterized protein n=1 Tax=Pseudoloma neurophilia TaxID=146866 RepID=A0A0R0M4S5_9MICR|nr:hypothetical protein M153_3100040654 [Pseudoloma neurophilia]